MVEKKNVMLDNQQPVIMVLLHICSWQLGLCFLFAILFWTAQQHLFYFSIWSRLNLVIKGKRWVTGYWGGGAIQMDS